MSHEEYEASLEEAHYMSVLSDMVDLMLEHGTERALSDLLELTVQSETIKSMVN